MLASSDVPPAPGPGPGPGPLAAFFLTPWPWLAHAATWAGGMLAVNQLLRVNHQAGPATAFALIGAVFTAYRLGPTAHSPGAARTLRYTLVDAIFLGLAVAMVFPLLTLPLRLAGWLRGDYLSPGAVALITGQFVLQFYLFLAASLALGKARRPWPRVPAALSLLAALALGWSVWQRVAEHLQYRGEIAQKEQMYERETGRKAGPVASEIALSVHGFYGRPDDLVVDGQGRVVVVGEIAFYAGHEVHGVVRLNPDGSVDPTLSNATLDPGLGQRHNRVRLLDDDAVLLDVPQSPADWSTPLLLRRLLADGHLDEQPQVPVGRAGQPPDARLDAFDVQADGAILIGRSGAAGSDCVQRFRPDGTPDRDFAMALGAALEADPAQTPPSCAVTEVMALRSGKTLVRLSQAAAGGLWREGMLRRLHADGSLDGSFLSDLTDVRSFVAMPGGEVFACTLSPATKSQPGTFSLWKLGNDGRIDPSFRVAPGTFGNIDALAVQDDGKVLVGGRRAGEMLGFGVFRLLPDGRFDGSFGTGGKVAINGFVNRIVPTADGTLYILGTFLDLGMKSSRVPRYQIARLLDNGQPDMGFDPR
jgi:uncharacterized delta-60 repeat protein